MKVHEPKDRKTILVVDDSPDSLYLMSFILRCEGYRIIECTDGESAAAVAASKKPDLILIDVKLPGMSGLTATGDILGLGKISPVRIPVIAVSSNRSDEDHRNAFEAGCITCIDKPLERKAVIKVVKSVLEGGQDVFPRGASGQVDRRKTVRPPP